MDYSQFFSDKKIRINVEGNIGCGKTTLSNALAEKLKADVIVLEEFENNPYLPLLYKNSDVGFQTEMFFLVSRYKQYQNWRNKFVISDYDMLKNKIFAEITIKNQNDLEKFNQIYDVLTKDFKKADIIIYIETSTDVTYERIKRRNRDMEKVIEKNYLETVNNGYRNYFKKTKENFIKVDGDTFNVFSEKDLNNLTEKIIDFSEVELNV
ncbi:MAG TPA: deoxynucleoside kinase [Tepiditoga sp.]|nr:deoxynucleoside kinase [Thermotogota bacterium]HOO74147.1 deoxynucleoside kinase [Tepiditoga sp.]